MWKLLSLSWLGLNRGYLGTFQHFLAQTPFNLNSVYLCSQLPLLNSTYTFHPSRLELRDETRVCGVRSLCCFCFCAPRLSRSWFPCLCATASRLFLSSGRLCVNLELGFAFAAPNLGFPTFLFLAQLAVSSEAVEQYLLSTYHTHSFSLPHSFPSFFQFLPVLCRVSSFSVDGVRFVLTRFARVCVFHELRQLAAVSDLRSSHRLYLIHSPSLPLPLSLSPSPPSFRQRPRVRGRS